jgi:hypothetical protein
MRLLAVPFAVLVLAGCSGGPDASRAQDLLVQADAAQARLSSVTYSGRMSFSVAGQRFGFDFGGGAILKGRGAGDQWMQMRGEGIPGAGSMDFSIVRRGSRMTIRSQGQTQDVPVPPALQTANQAWGAFATSGLAGCVKKVDVAAGRKVNGEPVTRIAGVVDTLCAFEAVNRVASVGQATPDLDQVRDFLGDARATLFVSDRSHLVIAAVLSLDVEAQGQKMTFDVSYRLTSVNEPVRFP